MRGPGTWVAAAVLFTSALGGCATGGDVGGSIAPRGTFAPAQLGGGSGSSAVERPRQEKILKAPSAFDCRGEGGYDSVFEKQCEAETESGD